MYESDKPTKEKRSLFNFMERTKKRGMISGEKVNNYLNRNELSVSRAPWAKNSTALIYNKNKTELARVHVKKNKKNNKREIDWWVIN